MASVVLCGMAVESGYLVVVMIRRLGCGTRIHINSNIIIYYSIFIIYLFV